jgi:hypothetical protein
MGGHKMDAGHDPVRLHGKGNPGAKPKGDVVADILARDSAAKGVSPPSWRDVAPASVMTKAASVANLQA